MDKSVENNMQYAHKMEYGCILGLISLIQKFCMTLVFYSTITLKVEGTLNPNP